MGDGGCKKWTLGRVNLESTKRGSCGRGVPLADHALELQEVDDGEDHKAEEGTNQASGGHSTQSLSPLREVGIFLLGAHLNAGGRLISLVLLLEFCARLAVFA